MRIIRTFTRRSMKSTAAIMSTAMLLSSSAASLAFPSTIYAYEVAEDGTIRIDSEQEGANYGDSINESIDDVIEVNADKPALEVQTANGVDITVTSSDIINANPDGGGIKAEAGSSGSTNITVNGTVSGNGYGISAEAAGYESSNTITQNGRVDETGATSVKATAVGSGSNNIHLDGAVNQIDASAEFFGENTVTTSSNAGIINTSAEDSGTNTVCAAGGVLLVNASADDGGSNSINIAGDAIGINTIADHAGSNTVTVNGNVQSGTVAVSMNAGTNTIIIGGDAGGPDTDVGLALQSVYEAGENHIVIEGTLSGNKLGVHLIDNIGNSIPEGTLTVWKIQALDEWNGDAYIAGYKDENGQYVRDTANENGIQYIIRVIQPDAGAVLTAVNEDGGDLNTTKGIGDKDLQWAHAGDIVYLNIDLEDGYTLLGTYEDEDQRYSLSQDDNGDYYVIVPLGGGIVLSARVEQMSVSIPPAPAPAPAPAPVSTQNDEVTVPAPQPAPVMSNTVPADPSVIIAALDTAVWDGTQIILANGTSITVAELAMLDCAAISSDKVSLDVLLALYADEFAKALAGGKSVREAREAAIAAVKALL